MNSNHRQHWSTSQEQTKLKSNTNHIKDWRGMNSKSDNMCEEVKNKLKIVATETTSTTAELGEPMCSRRVSSSSFL